MKLRIPKIFPRETLAMALDNVRERLALHFDAEASLESRVTKDSYEVHIRMPYRTQKPEVSTAAKEAARQPAKPRNGAHRLRATLRPRGVAGTEVARG